MIHRHFPHKIGRKYCSQKRKFSRDHQKMSSKFDDEISNALRRFNAPASLSRAHYREIVALVGEEFNLREIGLRAIIGGCVKTIKNMAAAFKFTRAFLLSRC